MNNAQNIKSKIRNLLSHQGFMKYFKNTSWLFGERILRMVVVLFVSVYVVRYLGPKQYGLLSYAMAFVGLFSAFASLGLDEIVVRELVKTPKKRDELLGTAFWLKVTGAIIMGGAILIGVQFTNNDNFTNLLIAIIAAGFIFQAFNVININFQATVKSKYVVQAQVTQMVISSIAKLTLIWISAPLIWFAVISLSDTVVLAIGLVWNYIRKVDKISLWKPRISTAKILLKYSWPLILSGSALMVQSRIDQIMLKIMIGNAEVGYYSIALRLIEVFGFVPMILINSLSPAIINAKNMSQNMYQNRLLNFYRLNFFLFILIAIPIYLFAGKIVVLLFGVAYQPVGILLSLMAIRLLFTNMGVARGAFILIENLFKYSLVTMILGTIVNVSLNYILIPKYKSIGAIIATIASFSVTIFLVDIFYAKTRNNTLTMFKGMLTFYKIKGR